MITRKIKFGDTSPTENLLTVNECKNSIKQHSKLQQQIYQIERVKHQILLSVVSGVASLSAAWGGPTL
jgi:hypothetical protein